MTLTSAQLADLDALSSPHALIVFLRVSHSALLDDIRVVNDVLPYVRGGETWEAVPGLKPRLVDDSDGTPRTVLELPNIDRTVGRALRATNERALVSVEVLSSADFDLTVEPRTEIGTAEVYYAFRHFETLSASVTAVSAEIQIVLRDYSQEPWPAIRATQDRLPGVFR